ncbi:trypsin-like peptidase domain-containing protein [Leptospira sp. 96542]|nr:trypsin-like peptidase domain-containing protein [Leptospira sp. 96542]
MKHSNQLIQSQKKICTLPLSIASTILFFHSVLFPLDLPANDSQSFDEIRKSVVQIRVYSQSTDPFSPWIPGPITASTGSGFLLSNNRILTNAHVVSNAKFLEGQRNNQTEWYGLKVLYVAHDCDLAILEADNLEFYKDGKPMEFGGLPELTSPIDIVGYPIGGNRISVSRGIVSRIEQSSYAHTQIDSHLVVQVDAAINPGNSGGPALQNGKVVGVAFQASTKGENIGYIIPTIVIQHFLKDIEDGVYDGYVELGIHVQPAYSESHRVYYGIPKTIEGVFVNKVLKGGSAEGHLLNGDFLVSIDGKKIGNNGSLIEESSIDFLEVVDNKFANENIEFQLYRNKNLISVGFPAKKMPSMDLQRSRYDTGFDYFIFAGLVFQKSNRDLLEAWSKNGMTQGGSLLVYRFYYFNEIKTDETEDVVLYRKLPHPINSGHDFYMNMVVKNVNGIQIKNLEHFKNILTTTKERFIQIYFHGIQIPLILSFEDSKLADIEIKKTYQISGNKK